VEGPAQAVSIAAAQATANNGAWIRQQDCGDEGASTSRRPVRTTKYEHRPPNVEDIPLLPADRNRTVNQGETTAARWLIRAGLAHSQIDVLILSKCPV